MLQTIMDTLPGIIEVSLLFSLLDSSSERRWDSKYFPIFYIIANFSLLLLTRVISNTIGFTIPISILLEVALIKLFFNSNILKVVFWLTCFNSMIGICDIVIYIITVTILGLNLEQILSISIVNNTAAFISKLILWVIIMRVKLFISKVEGENGNYFIPLLIVPIVSIAAMILIIDYSVNVISGGKRTILVYLTVIGLFSMNIIVFYIYEHLHQISKIKAEISLMEQQLIYQQKYFKQLEYSYQEVRGIKHDIMRHITLIHTLAKTKEYAKLEEYTQELSVTTENMIKIIHSGNVILDAIFNEKYATAKNHKIEIEYMIEKLDKDIINPISLCIIVSNILDNAIEGSLLWKKERSHALIEVKLYLQKKNLIFSVSNNAIIPEIKEGLFLTNKEDKKEHGIGLKNVKKVIEENKGCFEAGYSNGKFVFVCRIPVKD